jgi:hypothetical protein
MQIYSAIITIIDHLTSLTSYIALGDFNSVVSMLRTSETPRTEGKVLKAVRAKVPRASGHPSQRRGP